MTDEIKATDDAADKERSADTPLRESQQPEVINRPDMLDPPRILRKEYRITFKDEFEQVSIQVGRLLQMDNDGFVIIEADGRNVLIPKDRIIIMREVVKESS